MEGSAGCVRTKRRSKGCTKPATVGGSGRLPGGPGGIACETLIRTAFLPVISWEARKLGSKAKMTQSRGAAASVKPCFFQMTRGQGSQLHSGSLRSVARDGADRVLPGTLRIAR